MTDQTPYYRTSDKITPPWSDEQVDALNTFQRSGFFHPFTCRNRGDGRHYEYGGDLGELVATREGWVCRDCDYTQAWAHASMADKGLVEAQRQAWRDWQKPDGNAPSGQSSSAVPES